MLGDQDLRPIIHAPWLPVFVAEPEDGFRPVNALDVDPQRPLQVLVYETEHLVGFMDFDRPLFQAVAVSEGDDDIDVHARDRRPTEIDRDRVRRPVVERRPNPFLAGHVACLSSSDLPRLPIFQRICNAVAKPGPWDGGG